MQKQSYQESFPVSARWTKEQQWGENIAQGGARGATVDKDSLRRLFYYSGAVSKMSKWGTDSAHRSAELDLQGAAQLL